MDSAASPADIDRRLAELLEAEARIKRARKLDRSTGETWVGREEHRAEQLAEIRIESAELNDEFDRRGGWSRFFLVGGASGHIHSSMDCSTCNREGRLTRFALLPYLSGKDVAEAVEAHGTRLCSVCFPGAPVEWTAPPAADGSCAASGTDRWKAEGRKRTYYGAGGFCAECGQWASQTKTGKIRKHKAA